MAAIDTTLGNLVIKDTTHAIDKDTRTLFAEDNRKNDKKKLKISEIPELHLLSYYGDITGPKELRLRNECRKLIRAKLKRMMFPTIQCSSNYKRQQSLSDVSINTETVQSILESIQITHISHYSFEFVVNISRTTLFDEYKTEKNTARSNCYLVSTYQQTRFAKLFDEHVTIGITSAVSNNDYEDRKNRELYNFYVDDFIQDLYVILCNTSWYDQSCDLPSLLWYTIAQFTMDCLPPVTFTRSLADEVILKDGQLHFYLSGELSPRNIVPEPQDNDSGDTKNDDDDYTPIRMDPKLEVMGKIFVEIGRIIYQEYNSKNNAKKLKNEYDKWKNKGFKKRALLKPINMKDLRLKLQIHQKKRGEAQNVNELKHIYYKNPNFRLKKVIKAAHHQSQTAQPSAMKSFMNFFSFNSKNKMKIPKNYMKKNGHRRSLSVNAVDGDMIGRALTERYTSSTSAKKKKHKKKNKKKAKDEWDTNENYNWNNDDYGTQYITTSSHFISSSSTQAVGWEAAASVPVEMCAIAKCGADPEPVLRSKSTGKKNMNQRRAPLINKNKKYTHPRTDDANRFLSMDMLLEDEMDANDDDNIAAIVETHSDKIMKNRPGSPRLKPTMSKPKRAQSHDQKPVYEHETNEMLFLESYQKSNKKNSERRRDSMTTIKVKNDIRKAYKDYEKEKGHKAKDVQPFVNFCKRKNIKKANWTLCKSIISEQENEEKKDKMITIDEI